MTVSIISLGCAKNLVDSERMLARMEQGGYSLTADPADADIAVINTCGFIQSAKEEAIETILETVQLKEAGTLQHIIVTGCLAERYKDEVAAQFPEVDAVIGIGDQTEICAVLDRVTKGSRLTRFAPKCNMPLTGARILATLPFFAYLKIAEGCSNGCTYCAIPQIRGKYRSVPMEDVLGLAAGQQIRQLAAEPQGVRRERGLFGEVVRQGGEELHADEHVPGLLLFILHHIEFLDADDALDAHVLGDFDSIGAPRRNHLAARANEMAFHHFFFDFLGVAEKPCEFGNGFLGKPVNGIDRDNLLIIRLEKANHKRKFYA